MSFVILFLSLLFFFSSLLTHSLLTFCLVHYISSLSLFFISPSSSLLPTLSPHTPFSPYFFLALFLPPSSSLIPTFPLHYLPSLLPFSLLLSPPSQPPYESTHPLSMELLPLNNGAGQGYGYVLYRTTIPSTSSKVTITDLRDHGVV